MRRSLLLLVMLAAPAMAQEALVAPSIAPSVTSLDEAGTARLSLIQAAEAKEAPRASLWRWLWVGAYGALTVGQAVALPFLTDPGLRVDFAVGAVASALGAALELFVPLEVIAHEPVVRASPRTTDGLAQAERLLASDAADEDFGVSWVLHVGNVLFNAAVGLVLGLGWHRWESAAWNFGLGVALGEAMILTQPHRLPDALPAQAPKVSVMPLLGPGFGGLAFGARW